MTRKSPRPTSLQQTGMREFFDEMVARPLSALSAAIEMLSQRVEDGPRIDGIFSRFAHALSSARLGGRADESELTWDATKEDFMSNEPSNNGRSNQAINTGLTDEDRLIIDRVNGALADGQALKLWWDQK